MDLKEHVRVNVNEEVIQLIYNNEGKINVMSLRGGKMEFEDLRISLINTLSNYSYIMSKSSANYLILTSAFLSCI